MTGPDTQQLQSYLDDWAGGHWHPYELPLPVFVFYYPQLGFSVPTRTSASHPLPLSIYEHFSALSQLITHPSIHPNNVFIDCRDEPSHVLRAEETVVNEVDEIPTLVGRHCLFQDLLETSLLLCPWLPLLLPMTLLSSL